VLLACTPGFFEWSLISPRRRWSNDSVSYRADVAHLDSLSCRRIAGSKEEQGGRELIRF
jgi:hypothetical protein